eukprot:9485519-Pyramimonas_sp.AAC.1
MLHFHYAIFRKGQYTEVLAYSEDMHDDRVSDLDVRVPAIAADVYAIVPSDCCIERVWENTFKWGPVCARCLLLLLALGLSRHCTIAWHSTAWVSKSGDLYVRVVFYCYLLYACPVTVLWHGIAQNGSPKCGDPYVPVAFYFYLACTCPPLCYCAVVLVVAVVVAVVVACTDVIQEEER